VGATPGAAYALRSCVEAWSPKTQTYLYAEPQG